MKKRLLIFAFVLLFIPLISPIQIEVNSELNQGETLVAKLSGIFYKPILENNVYFYRNLYTAVPLEFELLEIEEDYYISASSVGKIPGNYSLVIKNSEYSVAGGGKSSEDIKINFTILSELAEFSATPGIQILENSRNPFYLEIQNLKDAQITVFADTNPSGQEAQGDFFSSLFGSGAKETGEQFVFKANEKKQIELKFENLTETGSRTIQLSSGNFTQNIFVYVLSAEEKLEIGKLSFEQKILNVSLATNSGTENIIYLRNSGTKDFDNTTFIIDDSLKDYISVSPGFFEFFEANETQKIILNISSKENSEKISGSLKALASDGNFVFLQINLEIIEGFVPQNNLTKEPLAITKTCEEVNGTICKVGKEKCSGSKIKTSDSDSCCLAKCEEKKKSSAGKIIGWGIVIILVALYAWFYLSRYKKTNSKVDLLKVAEKK